LSFKTVGGGWWCICGGLGVLNIKWFKLDTRDPFSPSATPGPGFLIFIEF
ncbi:hypothetical protein FRX31_027855, partial [Thalictrum thalictroides]